MASSIGEDSPKAPNDAVERTRPTSNGSVEHIDDLESQTSSSKAVEKRHTYSIGASVAGPTESYPTSPTGESHVRCWVQNFVVCSLSKA